MPVTKIVLKSKPRSTFAACGEISTHSQTYSGVPKRGLATLPRLQPLEKQTMIGEEPEELPEKLKEPCLTGHTFVGKR